MELAGIELKTIENLKDEVEKLTGKPERVSYEDTIVGIIEYRDGTVLDVIRQVKV